MMLLSQCCIYKDFSFVDILLNYAVAVFLPLVLSKHSFFVALNLCHHVACCV